MVGTLHTVFQDGFRLLIIAWEISIFYEIRHMQSDCTREKWAMVETETDACVFSFFAFSALSLLSLAS